MSEPLLSQLSRRLACNVDESEKARARMHLLDWLACVAGARQSTAAVAAVKLFDHSWERSSYLGNVLEMDDVHRTALLHPGPVVWPAAIALLLGVGSSANAITLVYLCFSRFTSQL